MTTADRLRWLLFKPVLGPMLAHRGLSAASAGIGVACVVGAATHVSIYECPFRRYCGVPCPGCGLSRACAAAVRGDFSSMLHLHAFAPFFLAAIVLFAAAAIMPAGPRRRFGDRVALLERRVPLMPGPLTALLIYFGVRFTLGTIP